MQITTLAELKTFAADFLKAHSQGAVVGLHGDLGAGKTTFVRMCIEILSEQQNTPVPRVTSPTYVLHQNYSFLKAMVDHFDLYRLEELTAENLLEMGYFDALEKNQLVKGFLFVEWPERALKMEWLQLTDELIFRLESTFRRIEQKSIDLK